MTRKKKTSTRQQNDCQKSLDKKSPIQETGVLKRDLQNRLLQKKLEIPAGESGRTFVTLCSPLRSFRWSCELQLSTFLSCV